MIFYNLSYCFYSKIFYPNLILFNCKKFLSSNQILKKKKAIRIINRNKEDKKLFGQLIKDERIGKITNDPKLKNNFDKESSEPIKKSTNSELFYLMNNSKNLRTLQRNKNNNTWTTMNGNNNLSKDEESFQKNNTNISKSNTLPEIIIRNIETFPFRNNLKNFPDSSHTKEIYTFGAEDKKNLISKNIYTIPSVTKVLNATLSEKSKEALNKWKEEKIKQLGLEGFEIYYQGILNDGKDFHSAIHNFLSGKEFDHYLKNSVVEKCWQSLNSIITNFKNVRALESHVVHPILHYQGVIDCVADFCGTPMIIDWKKSDKTKETLQQTYDYPVQLAAYLGALNYDTQYPFQLKRGLIVIAYTNGTPAQAHILKVADLNKYWQIWLKRFKLYLEMNKNKNELSSS